MRNVKTLTLNDNNDILLIKLLLNERRLKDYEIIKLNDLMQFDTEAETLANY